MGVFDEMAARYDTPGRDEVAGVIAGALEKRIGPAADKAAIDYGCGTGLVGLRLAGRFASLLMVDSSPQMIEQVRGKIEAAGLTNVDTLCADFSAALPKGLSADIIFLAQVLLHIPDTAGVLRRLYRLLHPGGRFFIVDFDRDEAIVHERVHGGFVQADLIALAEATGFEAAKAETFYHGKSLFMNRDASLFLLEAGKPAGPALHVFFDYACPYCLAAHDHLAQLLPRYPGLATRWHPCEAHPRPDRCGPHSDLCIQGMFFARDQGADLWAWHRRMYAACLEDRVDVEDPDALARYAADLVDAAALAAALREGRYRAELAAANRLAYEESGVWAVPAYRMEGRRLDAVEDVGVSRAQLEAFLDSASHAEDNL